MAKTAKKKAAKKKAPAKKAPARSSKKAAKSTASKPAKKTAKKTAKKVAGKTVKKKAPAKKVAARKTAKKVAAKKPPKKAAVKKAPAKKKAGAKVAKAAPDKVKRAPVRTQPPLPVPPPPPPIDLDAAPKKKAKKLPAKELRFFKDLLMKFRDTIVDEINFLAGDNLNRSQRDSSGDLSSYSFHMADQGTDNFDREFALSLVSSEQDVLYEIDEALRRIDNGEYGICEMTGEHIEKERLKALPHARYCLAAQAEWERGRAKFRPFASPMGHSAGGSRN